jgi:hypothetical protein
LNSLKETGTDGKGAMAFLQSTLPIISSVSGKLVLMRCFSRTVRNLSAVQNA